MAGLARLCADFFLTYCGAVWLRFTLFCAVGAFDWGWSYFPSLLCEREVCDCSSCDLVSPCGRIGGRGEGGSSQLSADNLVSVSVLCVIRCMRLGLLDTFGFRKMLQIVQSKFLLRLLGVESAVGFSSLTCQVCQCQSFSVSPIVALGQLHC